MIHQVTEEEIQEATDHFNTYYFMDLFFIDRFQKFIHDKLSIEEYMKYSIGNLNHFLTEFRVARNRSKSKREIFPEEVKKWIKDNRHSINVNEFANHLKRKELSVKRKDQDEHQLAVSLASKILFLYQPEEISPFDSRAKKTIDYKGDVYHDFHSSVEGFYRENKTMIDEGIKKIEPFAIQVEKLFPELNHQKEIRRNRFTDKLLWCIGK